MGEENRQRGRAPARGLGVVRPAVEPAPGVDERLQPVRAGDREPPIILVVEDDVDDRDLIRWAFEGCRDPVELRFATTGPEALEVLFSHRNRRRPRLILLDLNIPQIDGREIIRRVRDHPAGRSIPIVVFTGSEDLDDVTRSYELGANSYFAKPDSMEGYANLIQVLESYWLREAELPEGGSVSGGDQDEVS